MKNRESLIRTIIAAILILFLWFHCGAQTQTDSFPKTDTHSYIRVAPVALNTTSGTINQRMYQSLEIGKSFGMVDIGIVGGRLSKSDTTNFIELKSTMDASQYGIFSNEFSFGIGKVFNSAAPYLFEASTTMFAQLQRNYGIGFEVKDIYQSGDYYSTSNLYYGLFLRYGLLRKENGGLHKAHHK